MTCAKICSNCTARNWMTTKYHCHKIWIMRQKSLVSWFPVWSLSLHFVLPNITTEVDILGPTVCTLEVLEWFWPTGCFCNMMLKNRNQTWSPQRTHASHQPLCNNRSFSEKKKLVRLCWISMLLNSSDPGIIDAILHMTFSNAYLWKTIFVYSALSFIIQCNVYIKIEMARTCREKKKNKKKKKKKQRISLASSACLELCQA